MLDGFEIRDMRDLTEQLDERERRVIRAHYGLGQDAQTLSEIGAGLGLTAERARQIEAGALGKLRAALSESAPSEELRLETAACRLTRGDADTQHDGWIDDQ